MTLDRQVETNHLCKDRAVTGGAERDLIRGDQAAVRVDTTDAAALEIETGYLAVLDQVDTHRVRLARESPGDVVVLCDAASPLQGASDDGAANVRRDVDDRAEGFDLLRGEQLGLDPVQPVRVDAAPSFAKLARAVRQAQDAALAEEDVVVELFGEGFPEIGKSTRLNSSHT